MSGGVAEYEDFDGALDDEHEAQGPNCISCGAIVPDYRIDMGSVQCPRCAAADGCADDVQR